MTTSAGETKEGFEKEAKGKMWLGANGQLDTDLFVVLHCGFGPVRESAGNVRLLLC